MDFTQIFDDGSTLSWDSYGNYSSTPAPANAYYPTNNSWFPSGDALTGALVRGFGKWVDYKTTPNVPQNTQPTYVQTPSGLQGGNLQIPGGLLFWGLLIGGAFVLLKD